MSSRPQEEPTSESVLIDSVSSNKHVVQDGFSLLHTERVLPRGDPSDGERYLELIRATKQGRTENAISLIATGA